MSTGEEIYWDLRQQAAREELETVRELRATSSWLRPRLFIDGDQWCALYGTDLMRGVAGFGKSPYLAYQDFDRAWTARLLR